MLMLARTALLKNKLAFAIGESYRIDRGLQWILFALEHCLNSTFLGRRVHQVPTIQACVGLQRSITYCTGRRHLPATHPHPLPFYRATIGQVFIRICRCCCRSAPWRAITRRAPRTAILSMPARGSRRSVCSNPLAPPTLNRCCLNSMNSRIYIYQAILRHQ